MRETVCPESSSPFRLCGRLWQKSKIFFKQQNFIGCIPPSPLEISEKPEQLRAIENGMTIGVTPVDADPPVSADVEKDSEQARRLFKISCGGIDFDG